MFKVTLSQGMYAFQHVNIGFRGVLFVSIGVDCAMLKDERLHQCRRQMFCDVRLFVRDRSSAATIDDLCLDRRRSRHVHRPGAEMFPTTLTVEQRAPRSALTRDVSSNVCPSKNSRVQQQLQSYLMLDAPSSDVR